MTGVSPHTAQVSKVADTKAISTASSAQHCIAKCTFPNAQCTMRHSGRVGEIRRVIWLLAWPVKAFGLDYLWNACRLQSPHRSYSTPTVGQVVQYNTDQDTN